MSVVAIGYIYRPAVLPPTPAEIEMVQQAGVDRMVVDIGNRNRYQHLLAEVSTSHAIAVEDTPDISTAPSHSSPRAWTGDRLQVHRLVLESVSGLGQSLTDIRQQLDFWVHSGVEIQTITPTGLESSRDPEVVQRWIRDIPHQLKSHHIALGHAHNRLARKPPPGPAPYGYVRQGDRYSPDPDKSAIVRAFFDRFLLYGSVRGTVQYLEKSLGGSISVSTARRWLTSSVYRGDLTFKDGVTLRDTHPALLSRQEAAQIDRWLRRNRTIASRSTSAPRALAGLVACATCQTPLRIVQATHQHRKKVYRYLRCDRCRYSHNYDKVFRQTITTVCQDLPKRLATFSPQPIAGLKSDIDNQIQKNETILDAIESKIFSVESDRLQAQLRRYQLSGETARLQARLEQLPPENLSEVVKTVANEPFWFELTESECRSYLREFIQQISIDTDMSISIYFFF